MSGLFGAANTSSSNITKLAGIQISSSIYGKPKPLVYGTTKISANMIDYDDWMATATQSQSSGKGGGGSVSGYTYSASIIQALCEGGVCGIGGVLRVWKDKDCNDLSYYGMTLYTGSRPQSPWATWAYTHPDKALAYSGTAYVCKQNMDLGSSGSVPNFNYEVQALLATEQDPDYPSGYDAMPHSVLIDFLTNVYYGVGWDATRINGGLSSYGDYCRAAGFFISPAMTDQTTAAEQIDALMEATNSALIWHSDNGKMVLNVVPYGDSAITGNGTTYTPNTTPLYDLGPNDFLGVVDSSGEPTGSDAITVSRETSIASIKNVVPVEYLDRLNSYTATPIISPCNEDVRINGLNLDSAHSLHMITRVLHAQAISTILAQRNVYVRNEYTFKLGWKYELLEPMDLVTLTDSITGLNKKIVRIVSIDFPDEENEEEGFTVTAEEWPFGVGSATAYATQGNLGAQAGPAKPSPVITPVIFEPPALMTESSANEIWIGTAGTNDDWGGAHVWISVDGGNSYGVAPVGKLIGRARIGSLTEMLPSGDYLDTVNTLCVSTAASGGVLNSASETAMNAFQTACYVEGEIIAYQMATLTGASAYNLTRLRRGGFGSAITQHYAGSAFMYLDDAVFKIPFDPSLIGKTLYVKLQSFNAVGANPQDLSECVAYSYTPTGTAYPAPPIVTISSSDTAPSGSAATSTDGITMTASGATASTRVWVTVSWTWPSNLPDVTGFEVAIFEGTDQTNSNTYLVPITLIEPSARSYTVAITPTAAMTNVNAAVRADYA